MRGGKIKRRRSDERRGSKEGKDEEIECEGRMSC
jgi:hypothetical protein